MKAFDLDPDHDPTESLLRPWVSALHHLQLLSQAPVLERVRRRYRFVVAGYVVMPEHVHLLFSEPERANPGTVIQVLKQRFARAVLRELRRCRVMEQGCLWDNRSTQEHVWQARFYDFVVYTKKKRMEKLHYMHQNPGEARAGAESKDRHGHI